MGMLHIPYYANAEDNTRWIPSMQNSYVFILSFSATSAFPTNDQNLGKKINNNNNKKKVLETKIHIAL